VRLLDRYTNHDGARREVLTLDGAGDSMLVVDRDARSRGDRRLVAHLGPDEPRENAGIVCAEYLARSASEPLRCRALRPEDLNAVPGAGHHHDGVRDGAPPTVLAAFRAAPRPVRFRLCASMAERQPPQLRWSRCEAPGVASVVSLREAIAELESYEPLTTETSSAIAPGRQLPGVSTSILRAELKRVLESPIVLNRGVREVVLARVGSGELSMSEIAIRCGRVKRDPAGNVSGETSWLARRLGLLPEGGKTEPTPWIHSDVLALIARSGLGIAPREVEL
jgi:hypothetical protein